MDRDEAIQLVTRALDVEEEEATIHVNRDLKVSKAWLMSKWGQMPKFVKRGNQKVEACDFCGESFHPTYACPYHLRYENHHSSSYASPQLDFCMSRPSPRSPQQEQRTIEDMEKDMIFDWLSPSTKKYPFDDWSNSSYQQATYSSMWNQPSRDIIKFLLETEQDMNLIEQELDQ
ncbi:hypothetical protein Sjap_019302 [Stephania japonica]|uniref:C2H2-type domain-containing protein n=1 Tax=Stephania japonica TaxID=461633 RepID=A0AAP0F3T1_9MAGN